MRRAPAVMWTVDYIGGSDSLGAMIYILPTVRDDGEEGRADVVVKPMYGSL